ncbi:hypothetical protein [Aliterella atlantica]|uniref:DUF4267 domain-containing protein n=1 Tax=Aliterella atlantica CENA595 TaxID=1618023 RepID=A0A0D8ZSH4_9CYAN|nr:hypothetical protein [Aliterella atlantica]KJH71690.1 hypothetical protein UH38_11605 [Aliterella atlantica CENA595]
MRGQIWYIALLIGLMCIIRFSLSAFGYANPHWFMEEIGISLSSNPQMPYAIRAWAIRDMIISVLVALADKTTVKMLLAGCVAIDSTDIVSAYLSGVAGLFGTEDGWLLKLTSTAVAALLLELGALILLSIRRQEGFENKSAESSATTR